MVEERYTYSNPDTILCALRALAAMLAQGHTLEWSEPPPRGREGPDRSSVRYVTIPIPQPARFDSLRQRYERKGRT